MQQSLYSESESVSVPKRPVTNQQSYAEPA
jgi:hypothetical protein